MLIKLLGNQDKSESYTLDYTRYLSRLIAAGCRSCETTEVVREYITINFHLLAYYFRSVFGVNSPETLLSQQMTMCSPSPNP